MPFSYNRCSLLLVAAVLLGSCGELDDEPFDLDRTALVDGDPEEGEPAVVFLFHNSSGEGCTGTVIAPRVVVTAKHCVLELEVEDWWVVVGPTARRRDEVYGVVEVRTSPGPERDNSDIAVLILDRDFDFELKRWAFAPWPGFEEGVSITAIGYGRSDADDPDSIGVKHRRDGVVVELGPLPMMQLGDREFITEGENVCDGDSGAPILFEDVLVGFASRSQPGCLRGSWNTRVSAFSEFISEALAETGACVPESFELCNSRDDDCSGTIDEGLEETCACVDGAPSRDEVCDGVDNDCNEAIDDLERCGCTDGAAPSDERCDGIDNDCDGEIPAEEVDEDGDGHLLCGEDCDDTDPRTYPGAPELDDGLDNDCDGDIPSDELDDDAGETGGCRVAAVRTRPNPVAALFFTGP